MLFLHPTRPARPGLLPHLPRLEQLIAQQQITRDALTARDGVPEHSEAIKDALLDGIHGLARGQIQPDHVAGRVLVLERRQRILDIVAAVGRQRLGDDEQGFGEGGDAPLGFALDGLAEGFRGEVGGGGDLEGARAGHDALVDDGVVDAAEAVADRVVDLGDGVLVGAFDEQSDGFRILDFFDEGVFLLAEGVFVDEAGPAEDGGVEVVDAVLGGAATDELEALHVSSLGAAEGEDVVFSEDVEGEGVDSFLVDDDEVFLGVRATDLLFELDDPSQFLVDKFPLRGYELVSLFGTVVVESGVDFRFLVFQRYIQGENVCIFNSLRHIWMSCAMVQGQASDELCVGSGPMLHLHDLHHV